MRALAFALALVPQGSLALSCLEPDIRRTYSEASSSERSYVVLHGTITQSNEAFVFEGRSLLRLGWADGNTTELDIESVCLGEWCGGLRTETEAIFFVEQTDEGLRLELDPCSFWAHYRPSAEEFGIVERCMAFSLC